MSADLVVVGVLLAAVGAIGAWFARDLARHDKKSSHLGVAFYRTGDVEVEGWRVTLHRLVAGVVLFVGLLVAAVGVAGVVGAV